MPLAAKRKKPPEYNLWARLNRLGELSPEWELSYKQFVKDIYPKNGRYLTKICYDQPFSKDNFRWTNSYHGSRTQTIDGTTRLIAEWVKILRISRTAIEKLCEKYGSLQTVVDHRKERTGWSTKRIMQNFKESARIV